MSTAPTSPQDFHGVLAYTIFRWDLMGVVGRPSKREATPPVSDERWAGWAAPVLDFLDDPRGWPELFAWAKDQKMGTNRLRNCICWLEFNRLILSVEDEDGNIIWKKARWLLSLSEDLAEIADAHEAEDGGEGRTGGDPDPDLGDGEVDRHGEHGEEHQSGDDLADDESDAH